MKGLTHRNEAVAAVTLKWQLQSCWQIGMDEELRSRPI